MSRRDSEMLEEEINSLRLESVPAAYLITPPSPAVIDFGDKDSGARTRKEHLALQQPLTDVSSGSVRRHDES